MKTFNNKKQIKNAQMYPSPLFPKTQLCTFSKFVLTAFGVFFLLWFLWLFISLLFFNNSTFLYSFWKQAASATALAAVMCLGYQGIRWMHRAKPGVSKIMGNKFLLVLSVGMVLTFVCQMIYVGLATTSIGWDVGTLIRNAKAPGMGTTIDYFQRYPNNLFLLLFYRFFVLVFHFFNLPGVWAGLNVINVLAVDVAILLTVLIARRLFGVKCAYIAWFFCTVTIAFFPYIIVPYSDTMGMPFAISILYAYLRICDTENRKTRISFSILMGFCTCVGILIKPTLVIPMIAIVIIHTLFHLKNKKRLLKSAAYFALTAVTLIASNACYQGFSKEHFPRDYSLETPLTHFAMMGLQEAKLPNGTSMYGAYHAPDVRATFSRTTQEAKVDYNLKIIKQRLQKMGVAGYLEFLNNKARWITSEGNFFWGGEGGFANFEYMTNCFIKELINPGSNQLGFYMGNDGKVQPGRYFHVYFYFSQAVWILLMLCIALPLFLRRKGFNNIGVTILRCSIFGLMLFLLFFEGRSRYLINQLPYFILLASYGLCNLICQLETRPKRKKR